MQINGVPLGAQPAKHVQLEHIARSLVRVERVLLGNTIQMTDFVQNVQLEKILLMELMIFVTGVQTVSGRQQLHQFASIV
jgi:hypothetical protein